MLQVKNISGGYGKKIICKNISFSISNGETLCVIGPNGSGKSTLIKLILGLLKNENGEILLENKNIAKLKPKEIAKIMAYVPQQYDTSIPMRVIDMVILGRASYINHFSMPTKEDEKIAFESLKMLDIDNLADKHYDTLSGGYKQLVLIARALCQKPKILIMDEPTASLDYANQQIVLKTIKKLAEKKYAIIFSSHNIDQAFACANSVLLLKNGELLGFGNPVEIITQKNLENAYNIPIEVIQTTDSHFNKRIFCRFFV